MTVAANQPPDSNRTPHFSVMVPAYNAASTLAETAASVQAQTFTDWELVIVDDGSTDGTRALADALASHDPRIRVITQENRGSGGAYNTAARNARADLLVMLSADDLLLPEHLATIDALIAANPEASVFTCDGFYEYPDGRRERVGANSGWSDPSQCSLEELLVACFYGVGAVYRRAVFDTVGGYRENIYAEDYLFWLLALANGFEHRHIDAPLSVHRRNPEQKSAAAVRMREADVHAVDEVIASGLLSGRQLAAAHGARSRLKHNIRLRKTLAAVLGDEGAERLIDSLRRP